MVSVKANQNSIFPFIHLFSSQIWEMAALSAFLLIREAGTRMTQRGEVSVDQSEAFILTIDQSQGTILVTGATASTRGAAGFSAFSSAKAISYSFNF